jgi:hypothetical protein
MKDVEEKRIKIRNIGEGGYFGDQELMFMKKRETQAKIVQHDTVLYMITL